MRKSFQSPVMRLGALLALSILLSLGAFSTPAVRAAAPIGQTIWLRAVSSGRYVSADSNRGANTPLVADRTAVGGWEQYQIVDAGGGFIGLRALANGRFVAADQNFANTPLVADRTAIGGAWEQFQWIDNAPGQVQLRSIGNNRYVSADLNVAAWGPLIANRTAPSGWETFTWGVVGTPPTNTPIPPTNTPIPPTNTPIPPTATPPPGGHGSPYGGTPRALPGTVQAEDYNTGGQGVAYSDSDTANTGGQYRPSEGVDLEATTDTGAGSNLGWTAAGEWTKYSVTVTTAGSYTLSVRVASGVGGASLHVEVDGINVSGAMAVGNTGGWQTWTTLSTPGINLSAGAHIIRLVQDVGGANINWLAFGTGGGGTPNFGPNVIIFDPSMSTASIQTQINNVYAIQQNNHFGDQRHTLLFKPGSYSGLNIPVGFYTQVLGVGPSPDNTSINGNLHSDAFLSGDNATQNFWRGAEGLSVTPSVNPMQWAVSQAVPFRRMHIRGNMKLNQNNGWSSGGWFSDVLVDGQVNSASQQQWISRNSQWGSWSGANWNMVFVGVVNAPAGTWPNPPYTKIDQTPIVREKPFLHLDSAGNWGVLVPSLRTNSTGISWGGGATPGTLIPISAFHIAQAGVDTAATINSQLAAGKHLLLMPGVYGLNDTIRVNNPNTVVLGLGFATLRANTGLSAMNIADVDGVTVAGLFIDAGITNSPVLMEVGPSGSSASHAANPTVLHDIFFRVGGAAAGKATVNLRINSHHVLVDHTWIWRADHGAGVGWTSNPSANGLIVNGNNVTIYGLFVEHYQQYQVLWNGNGGRVYFYQSEIPYDVPTQAGWSSGAGTNGWASYKVANTVTSHEAWGLGVYSVFTNPNIWMSRAFEVPNTPNVKFHSLITAALGGNGGISNVINTTGGATQVNAAFTPKVTNYP